MTMATWNNRLTMISRPTWLWLIPLTLTFAQPVHAQLAPEWYHIHARPYKDFGKSVILTSDGGFAVTGFAASDSGSGGELLLLRTDSQGNLEWSRTYGSSDFDKGKEILQTADGGYIIAGYSIFHESNPLARQALVMKTDADGEEIWTQYFGSSGVDSAFDIVPVQGGGFFVAGDYELEGNDRNTYLILLDEDGSVIWEQVVGDELADERTFTGCQLSNGSFVYGGNVRHPLVADNPSDFHIGSVDIQGNLLWEREFGGEGVDIVRRMRALPTGGFVLIGETELLPSTPESHDD
ncbi:MAG TPA: hypothetical protein ENH10_01045, partial [Bacteroidetes bacterium]|nr:hypothetical protein [Bacteroidota bacterium]HEX03730.1 hypothetical protein [Bacteroidota bacterium]